MRLSNRNKSAIRNNSSATVKVNKDIEAALSHSGIVAVDYNEPFNIIHMPHVDGPDSLDLTIARFLSKLGVEGEQARVLQADFKPKIQAALRAVNGAQSAEHDGGPARPGAVAGTKGRRGRKIAEPPELPVGLTWPTDEDLANARQNGGDIVTFLRDRWLPLIEAGYGELRWMRRVNPAAVKAIAVYERVNAIGERRRIPSDLRMRREKEATDLRIAAARLSGLNTDPGLAGVVAARLRRGQLVPL
jgi:hypothetical protein